MKKLKYTTPETKVLEVHCESMLNNWSVDNTGLKGTDGEQSTVIEGDLEDGDEVGSKGNTFWDDEW